MNKYRAIILRRNLRDFPAADNNAVIYIEYAKVCFSVGSSCKIFVISYLFVEVWEDFLCQSLRLVLNVP